MTDFSEDQYRITGDAATAASWVEDSGLPDEDKAALRRLVGRFPLLRFVRERDALLDHYEAVDHIALPAWFRESRSTLATIEPYSHLRIDAFRFDGSPREFPGDEYYEISPGYINSEIRELLFDGAHAYLIGQWFGTDRSCLAIDLENPQDRRIFEFAMEDMYDDEAENRPLRESLAPVFASYADLLGHIVEVRLPDGHVVAAAN
ncbi:hypothetical protein OIE71_26325 [Streptomyces sp. NBC_01725]|uniref:hypothetical protein n=1 Tax=Streptomyces sp. NBC_01725 TaxID=2975923 RepID=UPI002E2D520D|nr:hypothetical protein [Streptomyces sp. NBC_01725]